MRIEFWIVGEMRQKVVVVYCGLVILKHEINLISLVPIQSISNNNNENRR